MGELITATSYNVTMATWSKKQPNSRVVICESEMTLYALKQLRNKMALSIALAPKSSL